MELSHAMNVSNLSNFSQGESYQKYDDGFALNKPISSKVQKNPFEVEAVIKLIPYAMTDA